MLRGALDGDIATLHAVHFARIEDHIYLSLDDDPVVKALGPVHATGVSRGKINTPDHRTLRVDKAELSAGDDLLMRREVRVVVEVRRKRRRGEGHAEAELVGLQSGPFEVAVRLYDGLALLVVAGDVAMELRQVGDLSTRFRAHFWRDNGV